MLERTTSANPDFVALVGALDRYLSIRNGDDDAFFAQFNKIDALNNVVVFYENDQPVGCGAFKPYDDTSVEIKRMFVEPSFRGKGIAKQVLSGLEAWAKELGYTHAVLETGAEMLDAVGLYQRAGYEVIPNYGQYADIETSVCMKKAL